MTQDSPNRLFILDGMALAYRSYFAFITNPIRNSKGVNTSAIFGFLNTLLSIIRLESPTHLAACFDTPAPTERHRVYPEYKATRESMPEDLKAQIPEILRMLEAFNIPILRYDGYEADDTIGTLTRIADEQGTFSTYMVSLDKDLGQLISPTSFLWKPGKRGTDHEIIDQAKLCEQWGINRADQIIDILALMGDSSDNIPGVPGVGEKTAKLLITEFGNVENLLNNTDKLKGKRKETIEKNADLARLSHKLVTINRHVPIKENLDDLCIHPMHEQAVSDFLIEHDLKAIHAKLFGSSKATATTASKHAHANIPVLPSLEPAPQDSLESIHTVKHTYTIITQAEECRQLSARLQQAPLWCFDTETTGLDPLSDSLLGISICLHPHEAFYISASTPGMIELLTPAFESSALKIGHNLKFDLQILRKAGIVSQGTFFDTMLAHALLFPGMKHNMDDVAQRHLSYSTIKLKDIAPESKQKNSLDTASIPLEIMGEYAAEDADVTLQLYEIFLPLIKESGMENLFIHIEMPLIPVLADMEYEGVYVDTDVLLQGAEVLGESLEQIRSKVEAAAGHALNLNSPKQLGEFLFEELCLVEKPKKTRTGQYVTDEETLQSLAPKHEIVQDILTYREGAKLKGTYLDSLPRFINPADGRIHTQFHQLITTTGRLASQDPNLQNIPIKTDQGKMIRRAFCAQNPKEFVLLSADYSQIELRIMAALSGDSNMINAFTLGRDIHTETASRVYKTAWDDVTPTMRRAAKMVNFGIIYGISAFGLSQRLGCSRTEAAQLIDHYFMEFPGVKSYMDDLISEAEKTGYAITACGRRRLLHDINSANKNIKSHAERMAINTPIQGTAAEMIKIAMIRVHDLLKQHQSRLILQIHDELVIELHRDEYHLIPEIEEAMRTALTLPHQVPVIVEAKTGLNWLEAH